MGNESPAPLITDAEDKILFESKSEIRSLDILLTTPWRQT